MQLHNDIFYIQEHSIQDIVSRFGTPLYVYDASIIRARIAELKQYIGAYPKTEFLYAIKANYNPHLVKLIVEQGLGIDAVSVDEVKLGLLCGAQKSQIMFSGNNMTDAEMREVHKLGVLLNIGSLSRLEKYGQVYPGSALSIRFNPNIGIASHESNITGGPDSKFGISFKDVKKVKEIARRYNLRVIGVHQHIGSGWLRIREPMLALDVILEIASHFDELEYIDVGGGFGVPYHPTEKRLDMKSLGQYIDKRMRWFCKQVGKDIILRFEPGRYVVAESGRLLTRVNTLKRSISRKIIVGTDTGMNQLARPAMYGSYHHIVNVSNPQGRKREYDVVGNICECADYFGKDRVLTEVREGDILSIETAGAYGMSMASEYQFRSLPAEVLIDNDVLSVIRPRESFEDRFGVFGFPQNAS